MSAPKIALLVPCHNAAIFLPRLWATVRAQSIPFAEVLVYDDASTDGTSSVARELGATVIHSDVNQGPGAGRNRLLAETHCPWVHFHDADDALHPDFVDRMSARATYDDADAILCQVDWLDDVTGRTVLRWRYNDAIYRTPAAPADMLVNIIGGIGGLYRTATLRAIGGFRPQLRYWEDLDLHLRLWCSGARIRVEDTVLSFANRRSDSTSNANLVSVWRAKTMLLAEYLDDPGLAPLITSAIARESEAILNRQLDLDDHIGARASLNLALRAGADCPTTASSLLRMIRPFIGRWLSTRLQHHIRRRISARSVHP